MSLVENIQKAVEGVILDPKYHDIFTIVKGARNGAVYGAKVRFPHALVMIMLFRTGSLREKFHQIFKATRTHARNLAVFASIYKIVMIALKHYGSTPGKEGPYDTFVAGLVGGYVVFGNRNPRTGKISNVNQQIVIYVFARVVLAIARLSVNPDTGLPFISQPKLSHQVSHHAWPVFAALSWASVMYLFRWYPDDLQPSLRSSMSYIYQQSNDWKDLRTLLWHNK